MRSPVQIAVCGLLLGCGWVIGRAQAPQADFELIVRAPVGETTVECARGCQLAWVERGVNPRSKPTPTFTFACSGEHARQCSSGRIGGWTSR